MKAGRELDALVAEKVMGLGVIEQRYAWYGDGYWGVDPFQHDLDWKQTNEEMHPVWREFPDCKDPSRCLDCKDTSCWSVVPHYSTNISAAWEVVEKVWPSGSGMCLTPSSFGWAIYYPLTITMKWSQPVVKADTAPHAICLAALKAKDES